MPANVGGDRIEHPADRIGSVRFHVPQIDMAGRAAVEDQNDRFGLAVRRGSTAGFSAQPAVPKQAQCTELECGAPGNVPWHYEAALMIPSARLLRCRQFISPRLRQRVYKPTPCANPIRKTFLICPLRLLTTVIIEQLLNRNAMSSTYSGELSDLCPRCVESSHASQPVHVWCLPTQRYRFRRQVQHQLRLSPAIHVDCICLAHLG